MRYKATAEGNIPFTAEEEAARDAEEALAIQARSERVAKEENDKRKVNGVEIHGVMCSATRSDQAGLSAIAIGFTMARKAGTKFPDTRFEFENGASLVVTDENFDEIYSIWTPFRQSFFATK